MKSFFPLLFLTGFTAVAVAEPVRFYLGTYTNNPLSQGIYTGTLETSTGKLGPIELAAKAANPSFLALSPDGQFLYAVEEMNNSFVAAFRTGADGRLIPLNELPSGNGSCHVSVDATGHNVFVANYGGGNVAAFQTRPDGSLDQRTAFIQLAGSGPNLQRQSQPHLHSIYANPGNRIIYACDLGTDNIWSFDFDAGSGALTLATQPAGKVPPGSGPRHLALSADGRFAYVNGEMGLNVTAFARNPGTGTLTALQTIPVLSEGASTNGVSTAEIFCHPSGKWLYVSNRGRGSITVFAIGGDGKLTWLQDAPAQVKVPRGFGIDPTGQWLIVGGQQDNKLAVLKIDIATGRLSITDQSATVGAPICVIFTPMMKTQVARH